MTTKEIISEKEVRRMAGLARLGLSDEEVKSMTNDLEGVLNSFSKIQKVDTKGVPEASDITGLSNISREDSSDSEELSSHSKLIENVPNTQDGQIKVKTVF